MQSDSETRRFASGVLVLHIPGSAGVGQARKCNHTNINNNMNVFVLDLDNIHKKGHMYIQFKLSLSTSIMGMYSGEKKGKIIWRSNLKGW